MADRTIKFDIKAVADTQGLENFSNQLRRLKGEVGPTDKVLVDAVKSVLQWSEANKKTAENTRLAVGAINALTGSITAGSPEWVRATKAARGLEDEINKITSSARSANAVLNDFGKATQSTNSARKQINDLRAGLGDLVIQGEEYKALLSDIIGREELLGRRTGRANVVAANQAYTSGILTGFGSVDKLQQMPDTTAALRQRLSELSKEFPNVIRGSSDYLRIAREMSAIERELTRDLTGTTQALRQRSSATQSKIDAVRAYNEQSIRERVTAGDISLSERRRTAFGDVPQAMRTESGTFIAPPYRSSGYAGMGTMYPKPIGPQTAFDYFESRKSAYAKPIGPQTPLEYTESRKNTYAKPIGPSAPTELIRSIYDINSTAVTTKLQTMGRSYQEVAQQIRETAQAAGGSTRALQAERQAWEQLQGAVAPATREYRQAEREIKRVDRRLGSSRRGEEFLQSAGAISAGAFFGGPEGLIGGVIGAATGLPGGALGGAAIGAQVGIVRKAIGDSAVYSASLDKLRIALQGVTGGGNEYAKALEAVSAASDNLNIRQEDSLRGFTRLSASVIAAGGSVDEAKLVFDGINTAIKATGGSSEEAQAALLALSQVFSKGKFTAEELSGQLGERLPGAVALFARSTNRTLPQLNKDLKDGVVPLGDVIKFVVELKDNYKSTSSSISKSSEEAGARATVAWDKFREVLGRVFQPLGAQLQDSSTQFLNWATSVIQAAAGVNEELNKIRVPRPQLDGRTAEQEAQRLITGARQRTSNGGLRSFSNFVEITYGGQVYSGTPDEVRKQLAQNILLRAQYQERNAKPKPPNFPDPSSGKTAEDEAKKAEREKKKEQERQAQAERLAMQVYNDQVRLDQQLAENKIRLDDQVFQHRQELIRREREQQQQLDDLRQQTMLAGLSPEGRAAAGPINELLQRLRGIQQNRQELQDQLAAARQDLDSAKKRAANAQRFGSMYRSEDGGGGGGQGSAPIATGGGSAIFGSTGNVKNAPGWVHGHFQTNSGTLQSLINDTLPVIKGLIQQGTPTELANGQRFSRGMSDEQIVSLLRKGAVLHSHSGDGRSIDIFVPAGTRVPGSVLDVRGPSGRGGVTGILPGSGSSWVGHLDPASKSSSLGAAPATTTLANGREVRTLGAASAALQAAGSAGDVEAAKQRVKSLEDLIKLDDQFNKQQADQSVLLAIEQSTQSLRDQDQALKDNYQEWQIRNRLELENVKPELIDFEINKTRVLKEQTRAMDGLATMAKELQPAFDKIGQGDAFRKFIAERTAGIQDTVANVLATQQQLATSQTDPTLDYQRKMNALGQSTRDFNDTLKLAIGLSDQLSSNLASGFSSAASAIITGNGSIQQSFADLFNNVAKMFIDTISRVLADKLTQYFLSLLKPGFSPFTSFAPEGGVGGITAGISGAFGGFGGGGVAGLFSSALPSLGPAAGITGAGFAKGGISSGPTSGYPVTLHGTEAVIPLPNGRAVPVEMSGAAGTSVVVNVNMATGQSDVNAGERDGQLLGQALSEAVQAELIRQKRPGGILYR